MHENPIEWLNASAVEWFNSSESFVFFKFLLFVKIIRPVRFSLGIHNPTLNMDIVINPSCDLLKL